MPPAADQHRDSLEALCADLVGNSHVIVASNRGPVSFDDRGGGTPAVKTDNNQATGAMAPLREHLPLTWISAAASVADRTIAGEAEDGLITQGLPTNWSARFITPSRRSYHRFYNTVCNPLLWFLHHRSWGFTHTPSIDREAHTAWDSGFVPVSAEFAQEIASEAKRADRPVAVLLRDYHMHIVGGMVRELLPDATIQYTIDVPWPGPADWLMLPEKWRSAIFRSLLACDVVGFTSSRDQRSFLAGVEEFIDDASVDHVANRVTAADGHELRVAVYPPSVDQPSLLAVADSHRTETLAQRISDPSRHTFVTAERAEPHKNILRSIRAYGALLEHDRTLAERTRYLLVLAPPPPHLSQYRRYMKEIEQTVRRVNDSYGKGRNGPIELSVENNFPLALAAIQEADTLIAVPIADASGSTVLAMPLINQKDGNLIVSETSSVAELFTGSAAVVSPTDIEALEVEMARAIEVIDQERAQRFAVAESVVFGLTDGQPVTSQIADLLQTTRIRAGK